MNNENMAFLQERCSPVSPIFFSAGGSTCLCSADLLGPQLPTGRDLSLKAWSRDVGSLQIW